MAQGKRDMSASTLGLIGPGVADRREPAPFRSGSDHLPAELDWLRLVLHREILRLRAAGLFTDDPFRGLYISDEQVDSILLNHPASRQRGDGTAPQVGKLNEQIGEMRAHIRARVEASLQAGIALPLSRLADAFQLSEFECQVLVVCAAGEIDLHFETLYSYAQNDVNRKQPSTGLLLRLLCTDLEERFSRRSAFSSDAKLLREGLLRFVEHAQDRDSWLLRPLKVDERVIGFLLDQTVLDYRLQPFTVLSKPGRRLASLHFPENLVRKLARLACTLTDGAAAISGQTFVFCGVEGAGKRSAVEALCAASGRSLLSFDLEPALTSAVPLSDLLALLRREAIFSGADVFLAHAEQLLGDDPRHQQQRMVLERALVADHFRVFIGSETAWPESGPRGAKPWLTFDFPVPSFSHRLLLWEEALAANRCRLEDGVDVSALANKFVLTAGQIDRACREAFHRA